MAYFFVLALQIFFTTSFFCLHGFWWEVHLNSYSCSVGKVFFYPLASFKIFSLSFKIILVFSKLPGPVVFIVCQYFWKVLSHYYFKYFFCFTISFFFWKFNYLYVTFQNCPTVLGCSSLGSFYWPIFKVTDSFLSHVKSTDELIKGIFHLSYNVFYL